MKEKVCFSFFPESSLGGRSKNLPKDVFDECVERWSEFKKATQTSFTVEAEKDSEVLQHVISFIEERTGKIPSWEKFPDVFDDPKMYQVEGKREIEPNDLENSELFWCIPKKEIAKSGYRLDTGELQIERGSIMAQSIGKAGNGFTVVCTETLRSEIEMEDFSNILFKEASIKGTKPAKEPLWQIVGERVLPSVKNKLVNDQGMKPDSSAHGCWVDDIYFPPVLKYSRSDLDLSVGKFDVAVTAENWHQGIEARRNPFLICSKHFRKWCDQKKLKVDWIPVEVIE